jgi:SAM-dependent methyltransferase
MMKGKMARRSILSLLCFSPFLYAQTLDKDPEQIWQDFLNWLRVGSINKTSDCFGVLKDYQAKLAADGIPKAKIDYHMSVISQFYLSRKEGMALFFDRVYTTREGFFSQKPNLFLAQAIQGIKPGAALDVSMGQGRNSIYLAQQGWEVTGFDIADEGLAIARSNARKAGLTIQAIQSGYQEFGFGKSQWDLVAMIYAFFPIRDASYIRKLIDSIRPGGIIVFEHFLSPDPIEAAGRIGVPAENELLKTFSDFHVIRYEEVTEIADWVASGKPAPIVRLLATKR